MKIAETILNNIIEELLITQGLDTADLHYANRPKLFSANIDGLIIGIVGVENHGKNGLLRSLAVSKTARNTGCGTQLVAKAEAWAHQVGISTLYLLTNTATDFFSALGYMQTPRTDAPLEIANTAQCSRLCPESAVLMYKVL
jgi:amino-acid N-acetyltransferase